MAVKDHAIGCCNVMKKKNKLMVDLSDFKKSELFFDILLMLKMISSRADVSSI